MVSGGVGEWVPAAGLVLLAGAAVWLLSAPGVPARRLAGLRESVRERPAEAVLPASVVARLETWWRLLRGPRQRLAEERHRRACVVHLCFALAAELRAGRTPTEALVRAAGMAPSTAGDELTGVCTASRTGGDVPAALRAAGGRPGADGLRRLAACWHVGAGAGAGFALAVERLAGALRAEERHREEVTAQLAGPRSTTRLLAALPLLGLLMSASMGIRPLDFLLGTAYGLVCLGLGIGLDAAGVIWTRRLARRAEEGR